MLCRFIFEGKKQTTNKGLMHSRIIQIADSPIDKENFLDEDSIETGPNSLVDYAAEISEKERQLAIGNLVNIGYPKECSTSAQSRTP